MNALNSFLKNKAGRRTVEIFIVTIMLGLSAVAIQNSDIIAAGNPTGDLFAEYRFDAGAGQTAVDSAGNNDLSLNGAKWVEGVNDKALYFNNDDSATDPDGLSVNASELTISFWMKDEGTTNSWSDYLNLETTGTNRITPEYYNDQIIMVIRVDGTNYDAPSVEISQGWNHYTVVLSSSGGFKRTYKNGELVGELSGWPGFTATELTLGSGTNSVLDDVRIYSKALNASAVSSIYNNGAWRVTSQVTLSTTSKIMEITFDQKNSTHVYDLSGYENHGRLQNGVEQANSLKCRIGRCYSFDGSGSTGIDLNDIWSDHTESRTFMFWFKEAEAGASSLDRIISQDCSEWFCLTDYGTDTLRLYYDGSQSYDFSLDESEWHHAALDFNESSANLTVYIDGNKQKAISYGASWSYLSRPVVLGGNTEGTDDIAGNNWDGRIDELKIFNRSLTRQEIIQEAELESHGSLIDLRFDGKGGDKVHDFSGNGNHGIISPNESAGPRHAQGIKSGSLSFDGVDDEVEVSNISPGSITVSVWLNLKDWVDQVDSGTSHHVYSQSDGIGIVTEGSGTWKTWIKDSSSRRILDSRYNAELNSWHNIALTYDNTTGQQNMYVDGRKVGSQNLGAGTDINWGGSTTLDISHGSWNTFGRIDELKVMPYAVDEERIRELYVEGRSTVSSVKIDNSLQNSLVLDQTFDRVETCGQQDTLSCPSGMSGEIAVDESGNAAHGDLVNGVAVESASGCKSGRCLYFDGSDDYIDHGAFAPVTGSSPRTIAVWINTDADGSRRTIAEWGANNNGERFNFRVDNTDRIRIESQGAGQDGQIDVSDGEWHFVAVTYNGNGYLNGSVLWVDGVIDTNITANNPVNTASSNGLDIGADPALGSGYYFEGFMDELSIYNRSLSKKEIWALYSGGRDRSTSPGPSTEFRFDEGQEYYSAGIAHGVNNWTTIDLNKNFDNPVVIATGQEGADVSMNVEASRPVIRNVNSGSFEVRVLNDSEMVVTEDVGYVVMEEGHHTIDGIEVEAGTYFVNTSNNRKTISFVQSFPSDTIVADSLQTECKSAVSSRYYSGTMDANRYDVYWEGFDPNTEDGWGCGSETAGYIAMERANPSDLFESGMISSCSADAGNNNWCSANFQNSYSQIPVLLLNPLDSSGGDKTVVGRGSLGKKSVDLRATETRTVDSEQGHATNDIPWMVFERTTTVHDAAEGANGTLVGGTDRVNGRRGKALKFDGVDDYAVVPQLLAGRESFSVSFWVDIDASDYPADKRVFSSGGSATSQVLVWPDNNNGDGWDFIMWDGSSSGRISTQATPTGWTHITATWDGQLMRLYADGSLIGEQTFSGDGTVGDTGSNMFIGRDGGGASHFEGIVDDFRVYPYALSEESVRRIVNSGAASIG